MTVDTINGAFELGGALLLALNVRQLWRDKQVAGVHRGATAFFAAWGLWNLYYYPHLDQWMSFAGGVALVTMNALWLASLVFLSMTKEPTP